MTTGGSLQQAESSHEAIGQNTPPGTTPAPQVPPELRTSLASLIEFQVRLVGARCGVAYFAPASTRWGGIVAQFVDQRPDAGRTVPLTPSLTQKVEKLVADFCQSSSARGGKASTVTIERGVGLYEPDAAHTVLLAPLAAEGRLEGATALVMPDRWSGATDAAIERLVLASAKFETFLWKQQCLAEAEQKTALRETLELLDAALRGSDADAMAGLACHELQRRFACTRVSIGLTKGQRLHLVGMSGVDLVDRRGPAAELLEAAMEECAVQDIEVVYPASGDPDPAAARILRAHEQLSQRTGPSSLLSLPLRYDGDLAGVLLLERSSMDPFPPGTTSLLRLASEFLGPALVTRRLADRNFAQVARDNAIDLGSAVVGPRHTGPKLLAAGVGLIVLALAVVPIPARLSSPAEVRAETSRTIVPPFSGYLSRVMVKPGDAVESGQALAAMDTRDLELQAAQVRSERQSLLVQRDDAQAAGDLTKVRSLTAQADEAGARLNLIEDRLSRSEIRSPITGVVSRGELDPFIGARVEPTQPLLEVATATRVIVIHVNERDAESLKIGQEGWLASRALPGNKVPIRVVRINPAAEVVDEANVYNVEAELLRPEDAALLRAGMTGTAKLRSGWTTGLATLAGPILDEARLRLWW
jgi:RND family efflux transporter MFP subunit